MRLFEITELKDLFTFYPDQWPLPGTQVERSFRMTRHGA